MPNRGQALVIDSGWRDVADTALVFVKRFVWSRCPGNYQCALSVWTRQALKIF